MQKIKKRLFYLLAALVVIYLVLLIPNANKRSGDTGAKGQAFAWQQDSIWYKLEQDFRNAITMDKSTLDSSLASLKMKTTATLLSLENKQSEYADSNLYVLQQQFFQLAPLVAVQQQELNWYLAFYNRFRNYIKQQSQHWNMQQAGSRNAVYRLLYGLRAATEEVVLHSNDAKLSAAMVENDVPTQTPAASVFGMKVHSGDILVSRGGAEVSALISRGNDYPGNFSHVALLYVDEITKQPYVVEAHIEKGVAVSRIDQYEKDKKLRVMVLRPRPDLPAIVADPMLAHKAAKRMYEAAFHRHIPYDFKMNFSDTSAMFCSEVASFAYQSQGVNIWQSSSTISGAGVVQWLHDFGVENFVTQMPSDLEYDAQLSVVTEWRDPATLFKDHLDNAVMDALLEQANNGEKVGYNTWALPGARIIKGYCAIKNYFGGIGMIPEGMNATTALRNQYFVARYSELKEKTTLLANAFQQQQHYRPPYWQLVKMAEQAAATSKD